MALALPEGDFKAYLFDCDGTVADSMPLHFIAWERVLGEWGCAFPEELFYAWGGIPIAEIIATLNQQLQQLQQYVALAQQMKAVVGNPASIASSMQSPPSTGRLPR